MTLLASKARFKNIETAYPKMGDGPVIGVFDSGSGGTTVFDALSRALPGENLIYLGDHANTPYGERQPQEIIDLTREGVERLFQMGAGLVLLACNTAATVALRPLQENWLHSHWPEKRILGVHIPVVEYLTGLRWSRDEPGQAPEENGRIGVFATTRTIESGSYAREIERRAPNTKVYEIACPGLAQAIEEDDRVAIDALVLRAWDEAERLFGGDTLDVAVLGCTHYQLVGDIFRRVIPAHVDILSQPRLVAETLVDYLARRPEFSTGKRAPTEPGLRLMLTTATSAELQAHS